MAKVVEMFKEVDHPLCQYCPHNNTCNQTCMAIEALVQLSKEPKITEKMEMLDNVYDLLDIHGSFDLTQ